jgi:hypothetical protein
MSKATLRFVSLAAAVTLCILAQHPKDARAATCPSLPPCSTLLAQCRPPNCSLLIETVEGTCTEGGVVHKEYLIRCECTSGTCLE